VCGSTSSTLATRPWCRGSIPAGSVNRKFVQVCGDTAQVIETVQNAYDEGKRITVRSGGHCYENFVCDNEGGVLIDLSPMNDVYQETPNEHLYCVEGGATLWNVYNELYRQFGVTLPGGSCYSVGAGGTSSAVATACSRGCTDSPSITSRPSKVVRINAAGRPRRSQSNAILRSGTARNRLGALGGGGGNSASSPSSGSPTHRRAGAGAAVERRLELERTGRKGFETWSNTSGGSMPRQANRGANTPACSRCCTSRSAREKSPDRPHHADHRRESKLLDEFTRGICSGLPSPTRSWLPSATTASPARSKANAPCPGCSRPRRSTAIRRTSAASTSRRT